MNKKVIKAIFVIIIIIILFLSCKFILKYSNNNSEEVSVQPIEELKLDSIDSNNNSKYKLDIISEYGDNEAYHPKVLSFENSWNGYKYWMAYTPYPQGDDSKENPHIAVSNDLINWKTLNNLDTPAQTRKGLKYNSDSHIVYNSDLDRLECYWRYVDDTKNEAIIYRRTTIDGITWTDKEVSLLNKPRSKFDCVSPAILYEDGQYKMWYVDKNNTIKYRTSQDGINWSKGIEIFLNYEEKVKSWHLDVIHTLKGYEMLVVAYEKWELRNDMNLYYTISKDGINWETAKVIMKPTVGTENWDNKGIYRCSFIFQDRVYYIYYSGTDLDYHHGIGMVFGKDIFDLKQVTTDYKNMEEVESLRQILKKYANDI